MARPRQISDEQILAAMRAAVLSRGPKVPLEEVAAELGVTPPALLKRFGSRDELLLAALKPPSEPQFIAQLMAGPTDSDFREQLLGHFNRIAAFMDEVIPCVSALRESGIAPSRIFADMSPPQLAHQAIQHWLTAAVKKKLIAAREVETAAFAIFGAIQTRAFFAHIVRRDFSAASNRRYFEELADLFCRSLKVTARPHPRSPPS